MLLWIPLAFAHPDCRTMQLHDPARLAPELYDRDPAPPLPEDLELRDAYELANSVEGDHVVVRWGDNSVSQAQADRLLDAMEHAWSVEVGWGYPVPLGSDTHKLNVYVGDTGGPRAWGAGYYTADPDGWPMIVVTPSMLSAPETLAAHELFHALQDATGAPYQYGDGRVGAWYFEASAVWVEGEVIPEAPWETSNQLPGYSFFPDLPIDFFDYPDSGALVEYHQYGAFVFLRSLAEHQGQADALHASWLSADDNDPLAVLDDHLDAGVDQAFAEFALHVPGWQFEHGDAYLWQHQEWKSIFPEQDRLLAGAHTYESGGWKTPTALPQRFGTNFVLLYPDEEEDDVVVDVEVDEVGSADGAGTWHVDVVVFDGAERTVVPLDVSSGSASVRLEGAGPATSVWIVASVTSWDRNPDEVWDWRYRMTADSQGLFGGGEGCEGCGGTGGAGGVVLLALITLVGRRRDRA
jgi:hypothetical protein